jgi:N-methylhydantoinase A
MLDIATIGAGGGTIARADADGRLHVGPDSAGADPGPAAYNRGGLEATITDADVVLGYLNPDFFLGGALPLDADKARAAVVTNIAEPLGLGAEEAALAAVRINDVHMSEAVRMVAAKAGVALAECRLVACGGAGPVHAAAIADEIGIREVLVPMSPGVFAALGLLCTDIAEDYVQTDIGIVDDLTAAAIGTKFRALEEKAIGEFAQQGFTAEDLVFFREVDARYPGQGFEIRVEVKSLDDQNVTDQIVQDFHTRHREIYGHSSDAETVEIVSYRVRALITMPQYHPDRWEREGAPERSPERRRSVFFAGESGRVEALIINRMDIGIDETVRGPAIIEQEDTTTVVPPHWIASMDHYGTLVMTRNGSTHPAMD